MSNTSGWAGLFFFFTNEVGGFCQRELLRKYFAYVLQCHMLCCYKESGKEYQITDRKLDWWIKRPPESPSHRSALAELGCSKIWHLRRVHSCRILCGTIQQPEESKTARFPDVYQHGLFVPEWVRSKEVAICRLDHLALILPFHFRSHKQCRPYWWFIWQKTGTNHLPSTCTGHDTLPCFNGQNWQAVDMIRLCLCWSCSAPSRTGVLVAMLDGKQNKLKGHTWTQKVRFLFTYWLIAKFSFQRCKTSLLSQHSCVYPVTVKSQCNRHFNSGDNRPVSREKECDFAPDFIL